MNCWLPRDSLRSNPPRLEGAQSWLVVLANKRMECKLAGPIISVMSPVHSEPVNESNRENIESKGDVLPLDDHLRGFLRP
jgi:hypothetical protein